MLYILKIGGSVCTEKDENKPQAREETIQRIAREIKHAMEEKEFQFIIVHGAGAFGHKLVVEYALENGAKSEKDFENCKKIQESIKGLNKTIVRIFREEGIELFTIVPSEVIECRERKISKFDTQNLGQLLSEGKIPTLYGDMVCDSEIGACALSGDSIIAFLAKEFRAEKVFLGTDVDGIYSADPKKDSSAKRFDKIDSGNWPEVEKALDEASTVDVTGGMKGKIEKMRESFSGGKVIVFDANKENSVYHALTGEKIGTEIDC